MKELIITITNSTGLHARPAALIVAATKDFKSTITIKKQNKEVNLKSLLALLSLGVCQNDEVIIKADGVDEAKVLTTLEKVIRDLND